LSRWLLSRGAEGRQAADGSLSAKLDSLDQGAKDLPISMVRQSGLKVALELGMLDAAYDGTLKADGSEVTGEWKQRGAALPLTFRRVDKVEAAAPRPQEPKKPYPYDEDEVVYENKAGAAKLAGTLTQPPGRGPFLVLADHLTRKGIAVLRVDDWGVGGSTGELKNATTEISLATCWPAWSF